MVLQAVDSRPPSDRIRETALAAAYELSITTKSLPSDFEVPSIDDRSSKPILIGRFADIWGADRQGRALALKIPRNDVPEEEHDVLRVRRFSILGTEASEHDENLEPCSSVYSGSIMKSSLRDISNIHILWSLLGLRSNMHLKLGLSRLGWLMEWSWISWLNDPWLTGLRW